MYKALIECVLCFKYNIIHNYSIFITISNECNSLIVNADVNCYCTTCSSNNYWVCTILYYYYLIYNWKHWLSVPIFQGETASYNKSWKESQILLSNIMLYLLVVDQSEIWHCHIWTITTTKLNVIAWDWFDQ